jgi:lysophospholipase L1-like esterase
MLDKLIEAYGDVPVIPLLSTFTTSPYSPVERVQARNAIVSRLAAARGLRVIDLYSVSKANADRLTDGVHFDIEGYNALAEELLRVAETL